MHINVVYFILLYINIHRHVSVASAFIIRVSFKKTNHKYINIWAKCVIKTIRCYNYDTIKYTDVRLFVCYVIQISFNARTWNI
jgi:hypothetical protein